MKLLQRRAEFEVRQEKEIANQKVQNEKHCSQKSEMDRPANSLQIQDEWSSDS